MSDPRYTNFVPVPPSVGYDNNIVDVNPAGRPMINVGPVVIPDNTKLDTDPKNAGFNHFFMKYAEHFDPFIQQKTLKTPRFWHDRIPRGQFPLFQGTEHKTTIYRGGLTTYAGLHNWETINPNVTPENNPCELPPFSTYTYAWDSLSYSGRRTAWGSDPICVDSLKYFDQITTQLAWILETGAEFGVAIQEVWNRDTYIHHSVVQGRSYLMSKEYNGPSSARYVYDPFVKFGTTGSDGVANTAFVDKPFIVFSDEVDVEPINFDALAMAQFELSGSVPESAVGQGPDGPMFALLTAADDLENYFRGNEEQRRYWIESKPETLIDGYGLRLRSYRNWAIQTDQNQLRFKVKRHIASYTSAEAANYGNVGLKEFENKGVFIAEFVPPQIEGRLGLNGSRIPEVNPEYFKAELAICVVFMNNIVTNLFVPSLESLGSGTSFGATPGLNGNWQWVNVLDRATNPFGKYGNFYGVFEIFQRPEPSVIYATSFLYRRCTASIRSLCPVENPRVNPDLVDVMATETPITRIMGGTTVDAAAVTAANNAKVAVVTVATAKDIRGVTVGTPVTVTLAGTELTDVYVVSVPNSGQMALAIAIAGDVKYNASGVLEVAASTPAAVEAGDKVALA